MHAANARGFSLLELLAAMAIFAILAAIAYPAYTAYAIRGRLADATTGLGIVQSQMERHFQDNRTYATSGTFTTPCAASASNRTFGDFVVSCSGTPTANGYTLAATGSGRATGFTFTLDSTDVRATTAAPSGWNTCTSRWITRRGETC